jgi:hypothetical protein
MLQEDTTGAAGGTEHATMKNSQRLGSEVLLYTEGTAPMDFSLLFPPRSDLDTSNDNYVQRSIFTVKLGRGTLMIFKDCDDQFFCHEARFDDSTLLAADPSGYRLCFVFRWCTSVKNFRMPPSSCVKSAVPPPDNVLEV